jgi:hypothetical protein
MDFLRGDALNLRNRLARVLPHWDAAVPGFSHVLGMHAFGLEECNQYAEAERTARRALDPQPKDGWAVHAVAHVMEMQGRIDEGIAWLASRTHDSRTPPSRSPSTRARACRFSARASISSAGRVRRRRPPTLARSRCRRRICTRARAAGDLPAWSRRWWLRGRPPSGRVATQRPDRRIATGCAVR